jgi:UDPglucose 6-dehydrogenase
MDDDVTKMDTLREGTAPFYEPGLKEMALRNMHRGMLSLTTSVAEGVKQAEIVFICVGTPQKSNGEADLSYVEMASKRVAKAIDSYKVIVEKSTVPVRTGNWIRNTMKLNSPSNSAFDIVSNPEFLREGTAIHDFMHPDRIVIGAESERAANTMTDLYKPLNAPILVTNIETAELIKHASNSFLALKISYINAIANICERVGADVVKVAEGMGHDKRIGREFLEAGVGYGGYCFPKDLAAFIRTAEDAGYDFELLRNIQKINDSQRQQIVSKAKGILKNLNGKTVGVLGLSFKPNTDDMREAPSIDIIRRLQQERVRIKAYDPQAMENAKAILDDVEYCKDPYDVARDSDALILITEWDEFRSLGLSRIKGLLKQPVVIDGRNVYDPEKMKQLGFVYQGVGR